jgi:lysylphosphatidylglycerol synthetase-like protein (DUF2156 family)
LLRILIERGWLVALPFLAWLIWQAWARHTGRAMGSTPWPWLFAAGVALFSVSMIVGVFFHRDNRDDLYVPGEVTAGGRITPGRFVTQPSK